MKETQITTKRIPTKNKNILEIFYNPETSLLVVDLISGKLPGGNEIVRMTIDEKKLLKHLK